HEIAVYPLLDLKLRRTDCYRIIRDAGLPIPPKSSCWFCPMHNLTDWADLRRTDPDLFERACSLERLLAERRAALGKDRVYLTRYGATHGLPLAQVVPDGADLLPLFGEEDDSCESGWCMT